MKPALAFRQPKHPKSWNDLPNGNVILQQINQHIARWSPRFFGYYLVKLGALSADIDTSTCNIKNQTRISQQVNCADIIADIDDLPILEHSVDVCILSHGLEFSVDPHHVVREANRILIPNGYLVITGYNPFSLAGLNKLLPFRRSKSPWREHFFSPMRVKDWLHLMGYEILTDKRSLFSTLNAHYAENAIANLGRKFCEKYLSSFGSIYFIVAKKRVLPLTPIKPKWQLRPSFEPINVSTQISPKNVLKQRQNNKCN
jgi:ubiquinone/menaquinone biosynthesis C-methylase UbiE